MENGSAARRSVSRARSRIYPGAQRVASGRGVGRGQGVFTRIIRQGTVERKTDESHETKKRRRGDGGNMSHSADLL